jgi:DNA processing protein
VTDSPKELIGASYPSRLRDLEKPPSTVYVHGELPRGPAVAIVGTRRPTAEGAAFARGLAKDLATLGVAVFSGGALGIDTAAHLGALDAQGATVVVAPSSFDRPYPETNAALFRRIVEEGGAFLTAYPSGTKPARHRFFERNAALAALVDVLIMVESAVRGGARNAVKAARVLGRRALVTPGAPWHPKSGGCIAELRAGAGVAASLNDVLLALGLPLPQAEDAEEPLSDRQLSFDVPDFMGDPGRTCVLEFLKKGPANPDEICRQTGIPAARVQVLLLTLTLELIVVSDPSGRVYLAKL